MSSSTLRAFGLLLISLLLVNMQAFTVVPTSRVATMHQSLISLKLHPDQAPELVQYSEEEMKRQKKDVNKEDDLNPRRRNRVHNGGGVSGTRRFGRGSALFSFFRSASTLTQLSRQSTEEK